VPARGRTVANVWPENGERLVLHHLLLRVRRKMIEHLLHAFVEILDVLVGFV
jgi:hypothetical protein